MVRAASQRRKMAEISAKDFILDFSEKVLLKRLFKKEGTLFLNIR